MIDPSQPLRDTITEIDYLRDALAKSYANIHNLTCCLAMAQIQEGPIAWCADPSLAARIGTEKLRLQWGAWNAESGQQTISVFLDGSETPLTRADVTPGYPPLEVVADEPAVLPPEGEASDTEEALAFNQAAPPQSSPHPPG